MAAEILTAMPGRIRNGVTTRVAYSADGPVSLVLNCGGQVYTLTGVAQGDGTYLLTFLPAGGYVPGRYDYLLTETVAGVVSELDHGSLRILPNLASGDPRSRARIILDAIEAVILGRATRNQRNVTVGDKTIGYMSHSELVAARDYWREEVEAEEAEDLGVNPQAYYGEFQAP